MAKFAKLGRRLIFVPGLMMNFYDLPRCVDLRKFIEGSNTFKKGQWIRGHFLDATGEAMELEILEDTKVMELHHIPEDIRNEWGSPTRPTTRVAEMFYAMKGYYPDLTPRSNISVNFIRFARDAKGKIIRQEFPADLRSQTEFSKRGVSHA